MGLLDPPERLARAVHLVPEEPGPLRPGAGGQLAGRADPADISSPYGAQLIYRRRAGVGGSGDTAQLVGADGTGFREIGVDDERSFTSAGWAADGQHVYGIDGGKLGSWPALYRLDLASGESTLLVEPAEGTVWLWASPSGSVVALRTRPHPLVRELWLIENGDEQLLAERRDEYWDVVWSPDGSSIAVSALVRKTTPPDW